MKKLKIALTAPVLLAFFGLFQIETIAQVKQETQKNDFITENQIILESLQKDIKPIQEDKKVYNEIIENYKTTIDGKELSQKDLQEFDHSKIKSVAVDFTNAQKGTQVDFFTTDEKDERRFSFGTKPQEMEIKVNIDGEYVDMKDLQNAFNFENYNNIDKKYDKIYINGKESDEKELEHFYGKEKRVSVKIKNRVLYVESVKEKNDSKNESYNVNVSSVAFKESNNTNLLDLALEDFTKQINIPFTHGNYEMLKNKNIVFTLDGKEITDLSKVDQNNIEWCTFRKGEYAFEIYGEKAKNGSFGIISKK